MPWLYFALNTLLLFAAVMAGRIVGRKSKQIWIPVALICLFLLFLETWFVQRPDIEYSLIPWIDYAFFRGWGLIGAFAVFGIGSVQIPRDAGHALLLFILLLIIVRMYFWWDILFGLDYNFTEIGFKNGICYQSTRYTCAPASSAMLLRHFGIRTSEKEMARLSLTGNVRATSNIKVIRGLRLKLKNTGYQVKIRVTDIAGLRQIRLPCLISLKTGLVSKHMVVLAALDDRHAELLDPEDGRIRIKLEEFRKTWAGNAIWIEKGD